MKTVDLEERNYKESIFKIILLFIISNLIIAFLLYIVHINAQKDDLFSAMSEKSRTIGDSVVNILQSSIQYGIPLKNINGGTEYLNNRLKSAKELEYIVITDASGEIIAKSDDLEEGNNVKGYKESLKGKFKSFSKAQKLSNEELQPFKVYFYHNIPLRIMNQNKLEGYVHVGMSNRAVDSNIEGIFYDIAIILLAALVIGYEFLSYIFRNSVIQPMRDFNKSLKQVVNKDFSQITTPRTKDTFGETLSVLNENILRLTTWYTALKDRFSNIKINNGHYDLIKDSIRDLELNFKMPADTLKVEPIPPVVSNLRLVMFLVVFGEAIILASIPSYAAQFYQSSFFISKPMLSALPIILNMTFTALFIPVAPLLSYRFGFRKSFVIGSLTMALGYIIAFMLRDLTGLLISRSITAVGFAICYVCCQNYVAAYATEESRIQSYAIFSIASGAGFICGAPIGGILIDNIGYRSLFLLSSLVAITCFSISRKYIVDLPHVTLTKKRTTKKGIKDLFKIPDLVFAVIFSALPTRFLFSSVICFLYPLYLYSLGNTQSVIGRIMMIFGILTFIFAAHVPKLIAKLKNPSLVVVGSSCLIAIPMLLDPLFKTTGEVALQIAINTICTIFYVSSFMLVLDNISIRESESHTKAQSFTLG